MNPESDRILDHFLNPNLPLPLYTIAGMLYTVAHELATQLDSDNHAASAEVTTGLRKLREAKDCFVLAKIIRDKETTNV
jgi:hypothetical protein